MAANAHLKVFAALTDGAYYDTGDPACLAEAKRAGEAWSQKKRQLEEARSHPRPLPEGVHARLAEALGVSASSATAGHDRLYRALMGVPPVRVGPSSGPEARDLKEIARNGKLSPGAIALIEQAERAKGAR